MISGSPFLEVLIYEEYQQNQTKDMEGKVLGTKKVFLKLLNQRKIVLLILVLKTLILQFNWSINPKFCLVWSFQKLKIVFLTFFVKMSNHGENHPVKTKLFLVLEMFFN